MSTSNSTGTSFRGSQFGLQMINTLPATVGVLAVYLERPFRDQPIQRQIRARLQETTILLLQVLQTLGLVTKTAIFLVPTTATLLRYAEGPTSFTNRLALDHCHFGFAQQADDLFCGIAITSHSVLFLRKKRAQFFRRSSGRSGRNLRGHSTDRIQMCNLFQCRKL